MIDSSICSGGRTSRTISQRSTSPRVTDTIDLHHVGLRALQQDEAHPAVDRHVLARVDGAHHVLGRIAQADVGEAQGLVGHLGPAAGEDDLAGGDDLVPGQGCQRVQDGSGGRRWACRG